LALGEFETKLIIACGGAEHVNEHPKEKFLIVFEKGELKK